MDYWTCVLSKLNKPLLVTPPQLIEVFWACHDSRVVQDKILCLECLPLLHVDVTPEHKEPESYYGPTNKALQIPFNPWHDIWPGSWVFLRLEDPFICLV